MLSEELAASVGSFGEQLLSDNKDQEIGEMIADYKFKKILSSFDARYQKRVYQLMHYSLHWSADDGCDRLYNEMHEPENQDKPLGFVYLVRFGKTRTFKIGFTTDLDQRLSGLQTASPVDLTLEKTVAVIDALKFEKFMHSLFRAYHIRGEWFEFDDRTLDIAKQLMDSRAVLPTPEEDLFEIEEVQNAAD